MQVRRLLTAAGLSLLLCGGANAAVSLTGNYFEDFNTLRSSGQDDNVWSSTVGEQFAVPGTTGWDGAKRAGTGTGDGAHFIANNGSTATGGIYSWGPTDSTERALGLLATGTNAMAVGVELVNDTGSTIVNPTLSFDREVWREGGPSSGLPNNLVFGFGLSGGTITSSNYLTSTAMLTDATFNPDGLRAAAGGAAGPVDGNANAVTHSGTLNVTILPGQSLFIRWQDFDESGGDSGIGIDNVSLLIPEPAGIALLGMASLGLLRRRRQ